MNDPDERPTLGDEIFGLQTDSDAAPARAPAWPTFLGQPPGWRDRILGGLGFLTFALVDLVVMYVPLRASHRPSVLPQALILLLLAFGLGSLLAWHVRGLWRPYGFGMMAGWVTLTLLSLGFVTGLN